MRRYTHEYNWAEHDVLLVMANGFSEFVECNQINWRKCLLLALARVSPRSDRLSVEQPVLLVRE